MKRAPLLAALIVGCVASPAVAQDHAGHDMQLNAPTAQSACEAEAARHRAMGHAVPDDACGPTAPPAPDPEPTAPAESGPSRAADAIWGEEAMRASREALVREHGGMRTTGLVLDRLEYRAHAGADTVLWDGKAWHGGDLERIWLESEGEGTLRRGARIEHADLALLYGRAVSPWFDVQAGVRQDLAGPGRTYLDLGIQGLAPYLFEVEGDLYLSHKGELTAKLEAELDQRITQRLILQPRAEIALSAQDVPELGIGAGVDRVEAGLRLRYEIARELAPYVGIEHERKLGGSADYARAAGEKPSTTSLVLGVRAWF